MTTKQASRGPLTIVDAVRLQLGEGAHPDYYRTVGEQLPGVSNRLGVPMGVVRSVARGINRTGGAHEFIDALVHDAATNDEPILHELVLVGALVAAWRAERDFKDGLELVKKLLPHVANWAQCDLLGTELHAFRSNREAGMAFLETLTSSPDLWRVRLALVLILAHYEDIDWLEPTLAILKRPAVLAVAREYYYGSMAWAWCFQALKVRAPAEMEAWFAQFLAEKTLDPVTARRVFQKIRESNRIPNDEAKRFADALRPLAAALPQTPEPRCARRDG